MTTGRPGLIVMMAVGCGVAVGTGVGVGVAVGVSVGTGVGVGVTAGTSGLVQPDNTTATPMAIRNKIGKTFFNISHRDNRITILPYILNC